jgi:hypothetical protein
VGEDECEKRTSRGKVDQVARETYSFAIVLGRILAKLRGARPWPVLGGCSPAGEVIVIFFFRTL